ncbi:DUF3105 domain-containing protein [Patescibacteria group bacterium]|nr:MAG: DUF3105 domain-containing protein [Patescibacteria group bacterium]
MRDCCQSSAPRGSLDKKFLIGMIIFIAVIIIGGIWLISAQNQKEKKLLMGEEIPSQGAAHVARGEGHPTYNSNPPTSGWHWGDGVAGPGIKDEQLPDELVLHSMEHGAVVVWYDHKLSVEQVEKIKKAFHDAEGKKIMLPRSGMDVPVALTSWGRLLKLAAVDEEKIKEFIEANSDHAPEMAPI